MTGGAVEALMKGIITATIVSFVDYFQLKEVASQLHGHIPHSFIYGLLSTTGDKRSRDDDNRGSHRDHDKGGGRSSDRRGENPRTDHRVETEEVSKTVIIKGLPAHTSEPTVIPAHLLYLNL